MLLYIILFIFLVILLFLLRRSGQIGGGSSGKICKADVPTGRRFNAKLYLSSTSSGLISGEGPVTPEDFTKPLNGFLIQPRPEPPVNFNLPDYQTWLLTQDPKRLKPFDRSNWRILNRGGRLKPEDTPRRYAPPPRNSEQAFKTLLGPEVQMLPQPEYLGYLPANFNIADEKQVSMNELNYINPTERLKAWELTHIKNSIKPSRT